MDSPFTNLLVDVGLTSYTWDDNGNLLHNGVYTQALPNHMAGVNGP